MSSTITTSDISVNVGQDAVNSSYEAMEAGGWEPAIIVPYTVAVNLIIATITCLLAIYIHYELTKHSRTLLGFGNSQISNKSTESNNMSPSPPLQPIPSPITIDMDVLSTSTLDADESTGSVLGARDSTAVKFNEKKSRPDSATKRPSAAKNVKAPNGDAF
ncbi:hypothetical protein HDU76_006251, partial [Blyttiomyces sp. JEL0837]